MNILVTGGTGFVGRHIVWRLSAEGHQVTFTGRNERAAQQVLAHSPGNVTWLAIDHASPQAGKQIHQASQGHQAVVHTAGLSSPWGRYRDFYSANVESTEQVVSACESQGVQRLIHISTPSLYFRFADCLNIDEDSVLPPPVNHYAATKALAETRIRESRIPNTVLFRPRAIFGPWDNTLMPRLLRVIEKSAVPTPRQGRALVDLTYIDNLVDAVLLALHQPLPARSVTYNLSNGQPICISDLLNEISTQFDLTVRKRNLPWPVLYGIACCLEGFGKLTPDKEPLLTRYSAGVMAFSQTLCLDRIRAALNYQPRVSLHEGIARYATWYREQSR